MIGVLMVSWFALAVLVAWGFHLVRRHYISQGEAQRRHPINRMPSSMYDDEVDELASHNWGYPHDYKGE